MLRGIAKYQRLTSPWSVFVDDDAGFECRSARLWEQPWDGVICAHLTPALVKTCEERKVPLVNLTDGPHFPGIPQVRPNNMAVGHMAAEDLVGRGYKNFAYVGFSNEGWANERRDGFIEGLNLLGRTCDAMETENPPRCSPDWDAQQVRLIAAWLQKQPLPLGLLACHDLAAAQVLEAARVSGLSVPEDIAVLGVNNDQACCEMAQPQLSSIALDLCGAGYLAAEKLAQLMEGQPVVSAQTFVEPTAVITRQSTDILAIEDRRISLALHYIREHACRALTVEEVVKQAGMARHDLERGFRKHLGRSPQAEIRRIRLAEIKRLLQYTDKPLKDIAELTGFEYVEYMCVMFKRMVGETPGKFRRDAKSGVTSMALFSMEQPAQRKERLAAAAI